MRWRWKGRLFLSNDCGDWDFPIAYNTCRGPWKIDMNKESKKWSVSCATYCPRQVKVRHARTDEVDFGGCVGWIYGRVQMDVCYAWSLCLLWMSAYPGNQTTIVKFSPKIIHNHTPDAFSLLFLLSMTHYYSSPGLLKGMFLISNSIERQVSKVSEVKWIRKVGVSQLPTAVGRFFVFWRGAL
jgi:hypothetical protein